MAFKNPLETQEAAFKYTILGNCLITVLGTGGSKAAIAPSEAEGHELVEPD
ncbi:MAG: hypothetical protein UY17_C0006G0005 [Candidatus Beckwithbacteria bacterium GW2011_GWC2_47_9]|uniref:Uncharacterized protein n=1 Tax=Candidatus Beckwithbacteria bacterium GW2011_GWC2_47_9 TaxID=1618373 RepID=A0A0G1U1H0_9BACT|nr:MAG: hypothetical protein UY17_C0006G0005 [Candidatus Beckwithbacteria bacterium GW2011_GWC2_47_9]